MGELQILARQFGLITREQALSAGLSSALVGRRVASKEWRPVLPGVYRHCAVNVSDLLMVNATVLWLGSAAVLSGNWAAWWHDLRPEPIGPVTVTVPRNVGFRSREHVTLRRRNLSASDVTSVRGVPVISRAVAALENAWLADGQDVVDRALQRHVSSAELSDAMSRFAYADGAAAARVSVSLSADGTVSPPERTLAAALRKAGLVRIKAGVRVQVEGRRCWLDFACEELLLAIEVDGVSAHSDPATFHRDRERQNALIKAGWTVLRYTPWQIRNDLPRIVAEIKAVLSSLG